MSETLAIVRTDETGTAELVELEQGASAAWIVDYFDTRSLGSGVSRKVYRLNETMVLKVQYEGRAWGSHTAANRNEVALWQSLTSEEQDSGLFARVYFHASDYSWIISEYVPNIGDGNSKLAEPWARDLIAKYEIDDLHGENYGTRDDGTVAIIDYGTASGSDVQALSGWQGVASDLASDSDSYCECGQCDCERCYPEGCDCETFEGCHWHTRDCSVCLSATGGYNDLVSLIGKPGFFDLPAHVRNEIFARGDRAYEVAKQCAEGYVEVADENGNMVQRNACSACLRYALNTEETNQDQGFLKFPDTYVVGIAFEGCYLQANGKQGFAAGARWWNKGRYWWEVRDRFSGCVVNTFDTYAHAVFSADEMNASCSNEPFRFFTLC